MNDQQATRLEYLAAMKHFGFGPEVMKEVRVCRVCGCSCGAGETYCGDCGAVLPRETLFDLYKAQHLYCPVCDTVVASTAVFCPECGRQLKREVVLPLVPVSQEEEAYDEAPAKKSRFIQKIMNSKKVKR